jgi:hypothetical protein
MHMGSAIILAAMLCVFFARDLQLLAAAAPDHFRLRMAIYRFCTLAYLISFTAFLTWAGAYKPLLLFRTSPFWVASVLWHGCIWLFCLALNRGRTPALRWLPAVLPTPVLLVAMASAVFQLQHDATPIRRVLLAAAGAACWSAAMSAAVRWTRRDPAGALESAFAIEFAGVANATVLILVPAAEFLPWF